MVYVVWYKAGGEWLRGVASESLKQAESSADFRMTKSGAVETRIFERTWSRAHSRPRELKNDKRRGGVHG